MPLPFDQYEDDCIRKMYETHSTTELRKYIPGRSPCQIQNRAKKLGVVSRVRGGGSFLKWTDGEIKYLVQEYSEGTKFQIIMDNLPFRNKWGILGKISRLGLKRKPKSGGTIWQSSKPNSKIVL
jgi:hypothetical protein